MIPWPHGDGAPAGHPDEEAIERYLAAVVEGDRVAAFGVVDELLRRGTDPADIVCDVLAPAQSRVGRHWEEGRLSVAVEHRATAMAASLLESLNASASPLASTGEQPVPVICCEGEWHTLPAQMAAAVLRLRGVPAEVVGPSLPADEIAAFLGASPPQVVAVSCSMPMHLVGAWRTIRALRRCGVIVVAGGRGFGPHGRWAPPLGAHHVAGDFRAGADLVLALREGPAGLPLGDAIAIDVAVEVERLRVDAPGWAEAVTREARTRWPELDRRAAAVIATREDVSATLEAIGSGVLVGDEDLIRDFVGWFEGVIGARGLPLSFVSAAFALLAGAIPEHLGRLRAMADVGLAAATQPMA